MLVRSKRITENNFASNSRKKYLPPGYSILSVFLKIYLLRYLFYVCALRFVYVMYEIPEEARRGHQDLPSWSYM